MAFSFSNLFKNNQKNPHLSDDNSPKRKTFKFNVSQHLRLGVLRMDHFVNYKTTIEDLDEDTISIAIPLEKGNYIPLRQGQKVTVTIYESTGMYSFSTVISKVLDGTIPLVELNKPKQIRKIQRREYIRTRTNMEVKYQVPVRERAKCMPILVRTGVVRTYDISAGGICIVMNQQFPVGLILELFIELSDIDATCDVLGEILRVKKDFFTGKYLTAMRFTFIPDLARSNIEKFVLINEKI